jgi:hypothetical protein
MEPKESDQLIPDPSVAADEEYVRSQIGSVGSGLLGGWSQVGFGGSFEAHPEEEDEVRREVRRTIAELARAHARQSSNNRAP